MDLALWIPSSNGPKDPLVHYLDLSFKGNRLTLSATPFSLLSPSPFQTKTISFKKGCPAFQRKSYLLVFPSLILSIEKQVFFGLHFRKKIINTVLSFNIFNDAFKDLTQNLL